MKTTFKLFDFVGVPVEMTIWFFVLLFFFSPMQCFIIFFSILIHEMAHIWVAKQRGIGVYGIKIDLFMGTANLDKDISERNSIPIVAAGPLSNLILGALSFTVLLFTYGILPDMVYQFFTYTTFINILLFLFNILPIFPLDGGRIVKDTLALKMSSKRKAHKIAAHISLITSIILLVYAINVWSLLIGIFAILFIYAAIMDLKEL